MQAQLHAPSDMSVQPLRCPGGWLKRSALHMPRQIAMPNYISLTEAAAKLQTAYRVLIIGCSGSGKTTLGRAISDAFGLRCIPLDQEVLWQSGWVERSDAEQYSMIAKLVQEDRWVMDGTNPKTFDLRLPRADLVLWPRLPRLACISGVTRRWLKYRGQTRPGMAQGCPEKLDAEFLHFIWTFEQTVSPRIIEGLDTHGPDVPVLVFRSRKEMTDLLALSGAPA